MCSRYEENFEAKVENLCMRVKKNLEAKDSNYYLMMGSVKQVAREVVKKIFICIQPFNKLHYYESFRMCQKI